MASQLTLSPWTLWMQLYEHRHHAVQDVQHVQISPGSLMNDCGNEQLRKPGEKTRRECLYFQVMNGQVT